MSSAFLVGIPASRAERMYRQLMELTGASE